MHAFFYCEVYWGDKGIEMIMGQVIGSNCSVYITTQFLGKRECIWVGKRLTGTVQLKTSWRSAELKRSREGNLDSWSPMCPVQRLKRVSVWRYTVSLWRSGALRPGPFRRWTEFFKMPFSSLSDLDSTQFKSTHLFGNHFTHFPVWPTFPVSDSRLSSRMCFAWPFSFR